MQHKPLEHNPLHTHIHTQKIDDNNELNLFYIARNLHCSQSSIILSMDFSLLFFGLNLIKIFSLDE